MLRIISPNEYYQATVKLAEKLREYNPEVLVPFMNGGMVPCAYIAEVLGLKGNVRPLNVFRKGEKREIVYNIQGNINQKRIVLIEDIIPPLRGQGCRYVKEIFEKKGAQVRIACPFVGKNTVIPIDYYIEIIDKDTHLYWKPARTGDRF